VDYLQENKKFLAIQEFCIGVKLNPYKVVTDDYNWEARPARIAA
jgi:hypothetical protein